jgi:hypothetical protein
MSDNKGFANALLIMFNQSEIDNNNDSTLSSLENTPSKDITDEKKLSISNFISKDLMNSLNQLTPVKEEINRFNYSHYSTDASEDKTPNYIRKGWVCELCSNFNYESKL